MLWDWPDRECFLGSEERREPGKLWENQKGQQNNPKVGLVPQFPQAQCGKESSGVPPGMFWRAELSWEPRKEYSRSSLKILALVKHRAHIWNPRHPESRGISFQTHGMVWIGKDLRALPVPWAGTLSAIPDFSRAHPTLSPLTPGRVNKTPPAFTARPHLGITSSQLRLPAKKTPWINPNPSPLRQNKGLELARCRPLSLE